MGRSVPVECGLMADTSTRPTRILLADDRPVETLDDYIARGGFQALRKALQMPATAIFDEIKKSGLRGRGGAGFPTGIKWEGVAKARVGPYYGLCAGVGAGPSWEAAFPADQDLSSHPGVTFLCCNFAEGEPGTFKDRYLIRKNPYQLVEGVAIAAYAIGVAASYIGVKDIFVTQIARLRQALKECEAQGYIGKNVLGSGKDLPVILALGPDSYLFGEDRAFLEVLEGKEPWPRLKGVIPVVFGLFGQPTVVNNVETLCHISHIIRNGADWFKAIGSTDTPGTTSLTLSGDVKRPGVYELPTGTTLRTLIDEYGGGPIGKRVQAVFSGPTNAVIREEELDAALDFGGMKKISSGLGSGGFIVYDETACVLSACLNFSRFLAIESCGQCPSCKTGTTRITALLERLERGQGTEADILAIVEEGRSIKGQGHCFLVTEEAVMTSSVIGKFTAEVLAHVGRGCPSSRTLILPKIKDFDEARRVFIYDEEYFQRHALLWETPRRRGKVDPFLYADRRTQTFGGMTVRHEHEMRIVVRLTATGPEAEAALKAHGLKQAGYIENLAVMVGFATLDEVEALAQLDVVERIEADRGFQTLDTLLKDVKLGRRVVAPPVHL